MIKKLTYRFVLDETNNKFFVQVRKKFQWKYVTHTSEIRDSKEILRCTNRSKSKLFMNVINKQLVLSPDCKMSEKPQISIKE